MSVATATYDPADQPLGSRTAISVMAATSLGMVVSVGIMLLYPLGVFLPAIAADTGWSRGAIAAAAAPALLIVGLCAPLTGFLVDRFGPRRVLIAGVVGQVAGLVLLGLGTPTIGTFAIGYSLAALLGAAQSHVPFSHAIAGWFRRRRGTAAGLGFGMAGVGVAIVPVCAQLLIDACGWRLAFVGLGLAVAAVGLPAALFLMRDPPVRATPAGVPGKAAGALAPALRSAAFWLLVGAFAANAFAASAGSVSLPAILAGAGMSPVRAAMAMGVVGLSLIAGRVAAGLLLDRFPPYRIAVITFLLPAIGYLLVHLSTGATGVVVAGMFFGAALGAEGDLMGYLLARQTGMAAFGRLFGIAYLGYAMASGFGPAAFALLTQAGGQPVALVAMAACAVAGAAAVAVAGHAARAQE